MIPLFAITLPVIVLFCGLSLDVGLLEYKKLQMQNAADAGAIGAELEWERNTGLWTTAGQQDASVNGFTNGTNGVTVTVIQVPTSGSYAGDYDAIQVTIAQSVKTIFMGALNGGQMTVSAQAVSLIPPCLVIQGKSALVSYRTDKLPEPITVTVLQNVTVLAAGQQIQPDPTGKAAAVTVVTLLLTPEESERAFLASNQGTIHFVLRNGADQSRSKVAPVYLSQLSAETAPIPAARKPFIKSAPFPAKAMEIETILGDSKSGDGKSPAKHDGGN